MNKNKESLILVIITGGIIIAFICGVMSVRDVHFKTQQGCELKLTREQHCHQVWVKQEKN